MTIYMITREHEYQGGGGGYFNEDFIDEDFGYFTSKEDAEAKLVELRLEEAEARKRQWESLNHEPWRKRKEQYDRIVFQNKVLDDAGAPLTPVPYLGPEPVYPGWKDSFSDYSIIEIEPAPTNQLTEGAAS